MSEMSSKLEQVLEFLVNGEQDKAEAMLHDAIVEKARSIHEELVNEDSTAEEKVEEATEEKVEEATDSEEAVEESKEEESTTESKDEEAVEETVGGETGDAEQDLKDELKQEAEDNAEEIEYEETNEDDGDEDGEKDDHDHEDVEDKVDDLEDALEELKDKFEKIMAGDDMEAEEEAPAEDEMEVEMPAEESVEVEATEESKEDALEEASLTPVKTDNKDGSEKSKSPVANANMKDMGAAPSVSKGGDEKGAPAPKAADMGATTVPNTSTVAVAKADGGDAKAKSTISGK